VCAFYHNDITLIDKLNEMSMEVRSVIRSQVRHLDICSAFAGDNSDLHPVLTRKLSEELDNIPETGDISIGIYGSWQIYSK
jgi:hypothetical protein